MSYKGQRDYKSCKVQSHTTKKLLNKIKTRQLLIGEGKKPGRSLEFPEKSNDFYGVLSYYI
jgi:hypothetical protein